MRTTTSVEHVFRIAELRELILHYALAHEIYGKFKDTSKEDIRNCRLVQKNWLETVTNCLRKANKPIFRISLNDSDSINGRLYVKRQGKLLSQFVNHIKNQLRISKPVPTFSLSVTSYTLSKFNRYVATPLFKCLELCGNGLTDLILTLPMEVKLKSLSMPNPSFPRLEYLRLDFARAPQRQRPTPRRLEITGSVGKFLCQLLAGSSHLNIFRISTPWNLESEVPTRLSVPKGFESATLPASLRFLTILCAMQNKHLRPLTVNYLPNLYQLNLYVPPTRFEDGLMFKVLENISNSIFELTFEPTPHDGFPKPPTNLRFPVLPNLTILCMDSINMELDNGVHSLQKYLPELDNLVLKNHTVQMFHKWTRTSIFKEKCNLVLQLVDENFDYYGGEYPIDVDHDIITSTHRAFPNLQDLTLHIWGADITGLQYVFRFMTSLQLLAIKIEVGSEDVSNSDPWDALLLGISIEEASILRETGDSGDIEFGVSSSIKHLYNLQTLTLGTNSRFCQWGFEDGSLISDAVFQFGFMQMPNLQELFFEGDFRPSDEMVETFKGSGPNRSVTLEEST